MTEQHYLDIGAVRIQSWLTRTPKLRGRRGGSTLLTQATDVGTISTKLGELGDIAAINDETGHVDGVISLKLTDPDRLAEVEQALVAHLRERMPGLSLSVTHMTGRNYASARARSTGTSREWPAPVAEWPAGHKCDWCSTWPAVPSGERTGERESLCEECVARSEAAGRAERQEHVPYAEKALLGTLGTELAVPDDLKTLTQLDGLAQTHLALIYADGNKIGAFIRDYLRKRKINKQAPISKKIDTATWTCLADAVNATLLDDAQLPIIPHTVGGDDVLVSVPAHRAWTFVHTLLNAFGKYIDENNMSTPSLSAGVVLHHYTLPLFQVTEIAQRALRQAKVATGGETAAIAWHDTTRDGHEPIDRPAIPLDELQKHWSALTKLAELSNAARQQLDDITRAYGSGSDELRRHATRVGSFAHVRPFSGSIDLADALGMSRWWWQDDEA